MPVPVVFAATGALMLGLAVVSRTMHPRLGRARRVAQGTAVRASRG